MRNKDCQPDRIGTELALQRLTEKPNSRAGIEDDDLAVRAHFDATGVAAVADRARTWCRNRTTNAPENYPSLGGAHLTHRRLQ